MILGDQVYAVYFLSISVLMIKKTFCMFNPSVYPHSYMFPGGSYHNPPIEVLATTEFLEN